MDESLALSQVVEGLAEPLPVRRSRARLRLPGTTRDIRVRTLALCAATGLHVVLLGGLVAARLSAPLSAPKPLVEVEFVEIAGAKGGGGSPAPALPVARGQVAPAPAPQVVSLPDPASRQTAQPAMSAAPVSGLGAASSQGAVAGGSGSGSGGGQGTGVGTSVGSGTGQGGIAVDRMPIPVRQPKPRYPMSARRMGQSGQVLLRLFVDPEGAVREVNVVRAEPSGIFEDAAVEAARKWRFEPAVSRGVAVGMWMTLPVRFALDDR